MSSDVEMVAGSNGALVVLVNTTETQGYMLKNQCIVYSVAKSGGAK